MACRLYGAKQLPEPVLFVVYSQLNYLGEILI